MTGWCSKIRARVLQIKQQEIKIVTAKGMLRKIHASSKQQNHKRKPASWWLRKRLQGAISKHVHHNKFIYEPAQVATRSQVEPVLLQIAPASIPTSSMAPITRREPEGLYQKFGEVKVDSSRRQQRKQGRRLRET